MFTMTLGLIPTVLIVLGVLGTLCSAIAVSVLTLVPQR